MALWNVLEDDFFMPPWARDLQQWRRTSRDQGKELSEWRPTADLKETKDNFVLTLELPGVKKEDINVTLEKGILTVSGTRQDEHKEEGQKFHRVERFFGNFSRSVRVPEGITEADIKPMYENGVLTVRFPSTPKIAAREQKRIAIH